MIKWKKISFSDKILNLPTIRFNFQPHASEVSGDLLEIKPYLFTPVKDFTPRMLKSTATSKLRALDCYNPPKKHPSRSPSSSVPEKDSFLCKFLLMFYIGFVNIV